MRSQSKIRTLGTFQCSLLIPTLVLGTIQEQIDAAFDGDIILIEPGTYVENLDFFGKHITVRSIDGPEVTIIDGNQNGSCVKMISGENESAVLDGFTLTNGSGWYSGTVWLGGGLVVRNSSSPTLTNLIVTGNTVTTGIGPAGGGISIGIDSDPYLENIVISNNTSGYGGGISIYQSSPTLENVNILENHAILHGGGIYIVEADPLLQRLQIRGNTADNYGGGVYVLDRATPTFNQVSVLNNVCPLGGGGMVVHADGSPIIESSIFWGNIPEQIMLFDYGQPPNDVTVSYSDIMGGESGINLGEGTVDWEEGNIEEDPWFCDPTANIFTLADDSPCIGSGEDGVNMGALSIGCAVPVAIDEDTSVPDQLILDQNYPNPFNPSTTIRYELADQSKVRLTVFDVRGQKVMMLQNAENPPGSYEVQWNGMDQSGSPVSTGVYLARLQAGGYNLTIKMLYLK
ncbi:MAG: T9SS type A sorting domain-containing protein [Candidatus Marinimicrobia bacterium]|nr:T9SS type A sorting domain-containing protein [Candidatus Neomarinimicrobiota bacterium]